VEHSIFWKSLILSPTMPINPDSTYIYLAPDGASHLVPGGNRFWSLPKEEIEKFGNG
jgi:hypothetical protein